MDKYINKENNKKLLNKIIENGVETNEEKEIYLKYLHDNMDELILKNKENNKNNLKNIFKYFLKHYKKFHCKNDKRMLLSFLLYVCVTFYACIAFCIELAIKSEINTYNIYSWKIWLGLVSFPVVKSIIKAITKSYLPNKKKIKLEFNKNMKDLKEEIKYVNNLEFSKSKEISNNNYHEERYLLSTEEKNNIYFKITNLITTMLDINNQEERNKLILKTRDILTKFNEARIKFESIDPSHEHLILQDKVIIYNEISYELEKLEKEVEILLNKQNRIEEDNQKVKSLYDGLKRIQ